MNWWNTPSWPSLKRQNCFLDEIIGTMWTHLPWICQCWWSTRWVLLLGFRILLHRVQQWPRLSCVARQSHKTDHRRGMKTQCPGLMNWLECVYCSFIPTKFKVFRLAAWPASSYLCCIHSFQNLIQWTRQPEKYEKENYVNALFLILLSNSPIVDASFWSMFSSPSMSLAMMMEVVETAAPMRKLRMLSVRPPMILTRQDH